MNATVSPQILEEMKTYYRVRAPYYDDWWHRRDRYDLGPEGNARWAAEVQEVETAFDALSIQGDVLELAPGTGNWTARLLRTASTVTAVDAAAEMVEINRAKVQSDRVTYVLADLFAWRPSRHYDAVHFGFWISHVPLEKMADFLGMVAEALRPGGKLFFVDNLRESPNSATVPKGRPESPQVITRQAKDGRTFEIVKNFFEPDQLTAAYRQAGLEVVVKSTANYFLYGAGYKR